MGELLGASDVGGDLNETLQCIHARDLYVDCNTSLTNGKLTHDTPQPAGQCPYEMKYLRQGSWHLEALIYGDNHYIEGQEIERNVYGEYNKDFDPLDDVEELTMPHAECPVVSSMKSNPPSFNMSKDLRARIEALPEVPRWYYQQIKSLRLVWTFSHTENLKVWIDSEFMESS
ncbi:hypothetical protein BDR07DRAFT_1380037 [Suillus spraguei]|nr:hypothetical protein BDR07DRAFT_1380037 [Suillus spraguei]